MKEKKGFNVNFSLGFLDILCLIFITLKLTGFIAWSWWWILLPLYGQVLLLVAIILITLVGLLLFGIAVLIFLAIVWIWETIIDFWNYRK